MVLLPNSFLPNLGESLPAFASWILTRRMTAAVGGDSTRGAVWSNSQVGPSSIHVQHLPTSSLASQQIVMAGLSISTAHHMALEKISASRCIGEQMGPLHRVPVELERPRLLEVAAAFTLSTAANSLCSWRKERGVERCTEPTPLVHGQTLVSTTNHRCCRQQSRLQLPPSLQFIGERSLLVYCTTSTPILRFPNCTFTAKSMDLSCSVHYHNLIYVM